MSDITRKMLYIVCVPLLFMVDLLLMFMGFNVNYLLALLLVLVAIARLSEQKLITESISDWLKGKLEVAFPDIMETGLLPNGRLLRLTIPILLLFALNIWVLSTFMG